MRRAQSQRTCVLPSRSVNVQMPFPRRSPSTFTSKRPGGSLETSSDRIFNV